MMKKKILVVMIIVFQLPTHCQKLRIILEKQVGG